MTTEQEFLKEVSSHVMEIIKDDGLHRHIRFRKPGTMCMHFDFITWPGYLCYSGDMGTYVFSRLDDMFEFFRTDRDYAQRQGKQLGINTGYWAEKLQAVDGNRHKASAMELDEDRFRKAINEYRVEWIRLAKEEGTLDKGQRRDLWEAVDHEVLGELDNGGERAVYAAYDFSWRDGRDKGSWYFQDLFERNFQRYTHHFLWCCYALAWGIQTYDELKAVEVAGCYTTSTKRL